MNFLACFSQNPDAAAVIHGRQTRFVDFFFVNKMNVLTVCVRQEPALAVQAEVCREAQLTLWCRLSARRRLQDGRSHAALPPSHSPRRAVTHATLPHSPAGINYRPGLTDGMFAKFQLCSRVERREDEEGTDLSRLSTPT